MIKIFQNDSIMNNSDVKEESVIFSSPNNLTKLKKKFINKDILIIDMNNYARKLIGDKYNKKLIDDVNKYVYMFLAFNNVQETLEKYQDINDVSFCHNLLNTYDFYKENKVNDNKKTKALKIIFDEYERLIEENNFITEYKMFDLLNESLKQINYDNIYFEDVRDFKYYEIDFINKIKDNKNIYIYANTINNLSLIDDLNKLCNINYQESNNFNVNKLFDIESSNLFSDINLVSCNDLYEEVRFISNDIKSKINAGLKFKDILIISNDIKRYNNYFKMLFDFPYFKNNTYGVLTKNFINIFFKILKGDFSCHNFIGLLKLNLLNIDKKLINYLDNYIYMWNLEDEPFYKEFIFNPNGKKTFNEKDYEKLNMLNDVRLEIINPIRYLISNIKDEIEASAILRYLFTYMDEEGITNNLALEDPDGYINFVDLLENLNDNLGQISINNLLDILNNCYSISSRNIKMIDEVNIMQLDNYVSSDYKVVYFIGLTEKDLPSKFSYSSLINGNDLDYDVVFDLIKRHVSKERNLISNVLLNDNVILTYHKLNDESSKVGPSSLLNKMDYNSISYKYELNKKMIKDFDLVIDPNTAFDLYGSNLVLSPSSLEMFAKCKYSYFLNYGLKLNIKEKMVFDNREIGTFVHFILENCIKNKVCKENVEQLVDKYAKEYFDINLRNTSNTISYVVNELKSSTVILLNVILEELQNTNLKPKYTELKVKDISFAVKLDNGKINISGIVDRVDTYEDDENFYYRIIDYKTGIKKFRLDDVLIGLNMQMLIYLMVLKDSNITDKKIVPTGFLYYPALVKYKKENVGISDDEIKDGIKDSLKMNGIINKDNLDLYDENNIGSFIDVISRKNINEEKVLNTDELNLVFDKAISILKEEGNSILSGDIKVNPIVDGKNDSCKYCLFSSICKFNKEKDKPRRFKSITNKEVIKILEGDINGMDN